MNRLMQMLVLLASLVVAVLPVRAAGIAFSGVVLDQGSSPKLSAFTAWLGEHADYSLQPVYTESYRAVSDYVRSHAGSLAWTCGAPFVEDHRSDGQQLIAIPLFQGAPTYQSLTITRADQSEHHLADFKGGVLAYSDPRSNSGFVVPAFELQQQGIDIRKHFRLLLHTGLHEGSIRAVLAGLADVANVDEYIYVEYLKSHPEAADQLKVLERFGPYPFTPIVAGKEVSPVVVARLQSALEHMATDAEGQRILASLGLDGFVVRPFTFYKPIADMLEVLKP